MILSAVAELSRKHPPLSVAKVECGSRKEYIMATGYTMEIAEGKKVTGEEFIIKCARAFGACISMRDDSLNKPIPPYFEADKYYSNRLETLNKELDLLRSLSLEEVQNKIEKENERISKSNLATIENKKKLMERYLKTLSEVTKWQPPTEEHVKLKEFAIEQLENSIESDCKMHYMEELITVSPKEYIANEIKWCLTDIEYATKRQKEESDSLAKRNKWIEDLRNSFIK